MRAILGIPVFFAALPAADLTPVPVEPPPGPLAGMEQAPTLLAVLFLTLFLAGLAINFQGWSGRRWRVFSPGEPPRVPWGVGPVLGLAAGFVVLYLILALLGKFILDLAGVPAAEAEPWILLGNASLQFVLLLGLALLFLARYRRASPGDSPSPPPPAVFPLPGSGELRFRARQALRGYICFFPLLVILLFLAWLTTRFFGLPWQPHPLVQPLIEEGRVSLLWPLLFVGVVLAPLAEEVFFRGLLFPPLAARAGEYPAAAATAALFATLHFNWAGWIPIFGLGVLLARSYQRTGSLLVPVFIHAFHNALFLAFAILA